MQVMSRQLLERTEIRQNTYISISLLKNVAGIQSWGQVYIIITYGYRTNKYTKVDGKINAL